MRSSTDPYPLFRFAADSPGLHLLITAGVHGDEYEPMIAARTLISEMPSLLEAGRVTIIPVVNRSAYARASRLGSDGLDLARVCPGHQQGSVTEVDAAFVSAEIRQADLLIDMHTGGALFNILPLAGYLLHHDTSVLEQQRKMAIAFGLPVVWGTEASPEGRTLSVARDAGVPAIYVEYGGGGSFNQEVVAAYKKGCLQVMSRWGMTSATATCNRSPQYMVEEQTAGSGFLQGKLPSPASGVFIATKRLGDRVVKDEVIGTVQDPLGGIQATVLADISGLVFFLRSGTPVKTGESLGGILPIDHSSVKSEA